ncbi:MAG TPA: response regulator [Pirellulales bacterium]|nr:response regulator [Pirellulales bacterium]
MVDDDLDNAESTARLVRHLGHSSTFANSGEAALQTAPAWNPDVLILDLAMPTMDGFELANSFRLIPQFGSTPLIAVSGYLDGKHRQQAAEAGFSEYLGKPFLIPELIALFDRVQTRIAEMKALADRTRAIAEASRELNRKSREGLEEYWQSQSR